MIIPVKVMSAFEADHANSGGIEVGTEGIAFLFPIDTQHLQAFYLFNLRQDRTAGSFGRLSEPVGKVKLKLCCLGWAKKNDQFDLSE